MSDSARELEVSKQNFLKSISQAFLAPIEDGMTSLSAMTQSSKPCSEIAETKHLHRQLQKLHIGVLNMMSLTAINSKTFQSNENTIESIKDFETFALGFQDMASREGVNYYIYIDPNFPKSVTLDTKHIYQVLTNLLMNAFLYTAKGGNVYIDIRSKNVENKKVALTFSITDTGTGIPKEKVKRFLKPFASSEAQGMGLGISSSFHILKSLGSQLKIASEENKGSRFSFVIDAKTKFEPSFEILPELTIGVYIESRELFGHAKIFYQYFISMGVDVVTVTDIKDEKIGSCHALFILTKRFDKNKQLYAQKHFPKTRLIPVIMEDYRQEFEGNFDSKIKKLTLPAVPSKIYPLLHYVETHLPKDAVVTNADDKKIMQELAKKEERDEPLKILVAEDNPINLKLVQVVLGRYDFVIDSAKNGEVAVQMCKKTRYDLILMDIDMPVMDGITANKLIKEYEKEEGIPSTPVVALTSHDLIGERSEIMASGLDEHMAKPLNIARLEMMLERYLGYKSKK